MTLSILQLSIPHELLVVPFLHIPVECEASSSSLAILSHV